MYKAELKTASVSCSPNWCGTQRYTCLSLQSTEIKDLYVLPHLTLIFFILKRNFMSFLPIGNMYMYCLPSPQECQKDIGPSQRAKVMDGCEPPHE